METEQVQSLAGPALPPEQWTRPGPVMESPTLSKLAEALAKAQGSMKNAKADTDNTFFGTRYATLSAVWDACREALSANGLSVVQRASIIKGGVSVSTLLLHSSGEFLRNDFAMPVDKATPQGYGLTITYCRRYTLAALVGIAQEDDDGAVGSGTGKKKEDAPRPPSPAAQIAAERAAVKKAKEAAQTPEQQARAVRVNELWKKAKAAGTSSADFTRWTTGVLRHAKPSAELTDDEVGTLEVALADLLSAQQH